MKQIIKRISLVAILALLLTLLPSAHAEGDDERFQDKTWEQVVQTFLEEKNVDPERVSAGYCNTVTGEEYYLNGDVYRVAASMYKIPINMVFTERIYNGEMDWDTSIRGLDYARALEWTIIDSNNDVAANMWNYLGGYQQYRTLICPYMGVDPETVDAMYWKNNYFTAEQMIHCLKTLYEDQERFPRLIDTLLKAEPDRFFKQHPQEFEIAHKYGYLTEDWHLYLNDCAICYTDDPICIVLFTDTIGQSAGFLADFCTLMCDYAQYHSDLRRAEEKQAAIEALNQNSGNSAAGQTAAPTATNASIGTVLSSSQFIAAERSTLTLILRLAGAAGILVLALLGISWALSAARKKKVHGFWAVLTILLTALALQIAVVAPSIGTLVTQADGDPQETVDSFFSALILGNYSRAYDCLDNYVSLGLETIPSSETGGEVYAALRQSYAYKLYGDCQTDGITARQQVLFEHLDLTALQRDLKAAADAALQRMSDTMKRSELYKEDGELRPEIAQQAYATAVDELLSRAEDYVTTTGLTLQLSYTDGVWRIRADTALLNALSGNAAYGKGGDLS